MKFSDFDVRGYRTVSVVEGYAEWAGHYERSVHDEMDLRLLARLRTVAWDRVRDAIDLACGTGRIGVWLSSRGVANIHGIDLTPAMLEQARAKNVYRTLFVGDVSHTGLPPSSYDLAIQVLADEHLSDIAPLYHEAARITRDAGELVIVGYHPFFLLSGIPTHFHRSSDDEPLTIESHIHLMSDHVRAAHAAGWTLIEMEEGIVDDEWLAAKPKWEKYRLRPVSYAMVWRKC
jgi:SAM-dependent methyltransferase